jgi:hypothetical protein
LRILARGYCKQPKRGLSHLEFGREVTSRHPRSRIANVKAMLSMACRHVRERT